MKKLSERLILFMLSMALLFTQIPVFANSGVQKNAYEKAVENLNAVLDKQQRASKSGTINTKTELEEKLQAVPVKSLGKSAEQKVRLIISLKAQSVLDKVNNNLAKVTERIQRETTQDVKRCASDVETQMKGYNIKFRSLKEKTLTDMVMASFTIEIDRNELEKSLERIKNIRGVEEVQISERYEAPKIPDVDGRIQMFASNGLIHSENFWNDNYKGEGQLVGILDTGADLTHKDLRLDDEAKAKIKLKREDVERLRGEGLQGKYYNEKIPYYYNYQDSSSDINTLLDSAGSRHGLHVAGIVGANSSENKDLSIKGVAPNAQLAILKVFSKDFNSPYTYTDAQVKAVDDAVKIGCDSINLSLGSRSGFVNEDNMISKAFKRAAEAGCLVAVAMGNEGNSYTFGKNAQDSFVENPDRSCAGQPGVAKYSTAVASYENDAVVHDKGTFVVNGDKKVFYFTWGQGVEASDISAKSAEDFVYVGTVMREKGAEDPLFTANKGKLKGKIALIDRGFISFGEKISRVSAEGARAAVIVNNAKNAPLMYMSGVPTDFPSIFITLEDGQALKEAIKNSSLGEFTIKKGEKGADKNPNRRQMSDFTSWGTAPDLSFKPEVSAPGGNIYSLDEDNKYQTMSGTSMATPHVAGAAAIVAQFLKDENCVFHKEALIAGNDKNVREDIVKLLLMNNSTPQKENVTGEDEYYAVRRQGAGLIDLAKILNQSVLARAWGGKDDIRDGKVEYKDTKNKELSMTVNLTNSSDKPVEYTVDLSMLKEIVDTDEEGNRVSLPYMTAMNFTSHENNTSVKLAPKESRDLKIRMNFSTDDIQYNAFVEGFIQFKVKSGEASDICVPYVAFYGNWDEPHVFDKFSISKEKKQLIEKASGQVFTTIASEYFHGDGVNTVLDNSEEAYVYGPAQGMTQIRYGILRNANDVKFELLDETGKLIYLLFQADAVRKTHLGDMDGMYYDGFLDQAYNKAGTTKRMYVRLSAKPNGVENATVQEEKAKIIYDGIAPEISEEKLIKENGKTYVSFKVADDIGLFAVGVQAFDDEGNLGRKIYINEDNKEAGFVYGAKEANVKIAVDEINNMKNLLVFAEDLAINRTMKPVLNSAQDNDKVHVDIDNEHKMFVLLDNLKDDAPEKKDDFDIAKGVGGLVVVPRPNGQELDELYAMVKQPDGTEKKVPLNASFNARFGVYTSHYTFTADCKIRATFKPTAPAQPKEPEHLSAPGIVMEMPKQAYYLSQNERPKMDPKDIEIDKDGNLNVRGYVTHYDFKKIVKITGEFLNQHDDERIAGSEIYEFTDKNVEHLKLEDRGSVIYDANALKFVGKHKVPANTNTCRYRVTVTYMDKDNKEATTSVAVLIWLDMRVPSLEVKMQDRKLSSSLANMYVSMSDDNLGNTVNVYRVLDGSLEKLYSVTINTEDFDVIASNNTLEKTFELSLNEGENIFAVEVLENGTPRWVAKVIRVYRGKISLKKELN